MDRSRCVPRTFAIGLFSISFVRVAKLGNFQDACGNTRVKNTYFSVFQVSCRNLAPGARLHISNPIELPPKASWRIRVSFEFRYGIRGYDNDRSEVKINLFECFRHTAPWFSACTTWPSTLRDLLIAEDSAIRDGSLPVNWLMVRYTVLSTTMG